MHSATSVAVITVVTQPPSVNFSTSVTTQDHRAHRSPRGRGRTPRAASCPRLRVHAWRIIATFDSVNVMNTLMLYMTTSASTEPLRVDEHERRGGRHQVDAVAHRQLLGQRRHPMRHPLVERHVRHHARPVDEARLRGDEQQRALGRPS